MTFILKYREIPDQQERIDPYATYATESDTINALINAIDYVHIDKFFVIEEEGI